MCLTLGYSTTIFLNILKFAWNFDFFSKMTQRQIRQARLGHMGMEQQRQKATELELQALSSISSFTDRIVAEQTPFQPVVIGKKAFSSSFIFAHFRSILIMKHTMYGWKICCFVQWPFYCDRVLMWWPKWLRSFRNRMDFLFTWTQAASGRGPGLQKKAASARQGFRKRLSMKRAQKYGLSTYGN